LDEGGIGSEAGAGRDEKMQASDGTGTRDLLRECNPAIIAESIASTSR